MTTNHSNHPLKNVPQVFDCPCFPVTEQEIEEQIMGFVSQKITGYAVAINAEKIYRFQSNDILKQTINRSIFPYPDGAGAVLSLKVMHGLSSEKINMPIRMMEIANKHALKVFIAGASEDVHNAALEVIKQRYPRIQLVGNIHGYHTESEISEAIHAANPEIIMLALGSPKQEFFAAKLNNTLTQGFIIGCGGALDILAGRLQRAPSFWIHNNLEWLYRLLQEPWRWRRQLFLPLFFGKLIYKAAQVRLFK